MTKKAYTVFSLAQLINENRSKVSDSVPKTMYRDFLKELSNHF